MKKFLFLIGLFSVALVVAACGANVSSQEPQAVTEEVGLTVADKPKLVLPTEGPPEVDECTACHVDKQRLINTAKPEEEAVEENEGAG